MMILSHELLASIHAQCFPIGWSAGEFESLLAQPGVFKLGDMRGFILCRVAADECEILTIAVLPAHQGQGVGTQLVMDAVEVALEHGAKTMFLEVAVDNTPAVTLYEKTGFRRISVRKAYYGGKTDALVMRLTVDGDEQPV